MLVLFLIYAAIFCNVVSIYYKVEELGIKLLSISEEKISFSASAEDVLDIQYKLFEDIQKAELVLFFIIGVLLALLSPLIVLAITSILLFLLIVFV